MPEVKRQRNAERDDSGYSLLHRSWGWNVPVVDIDIVETADGFVEDIWLEYDDGHPVCLVEVKSAKERPMHPKSRKAVSQLAQAAGIPAFIVRHDDPFVRFRVVPMNHEAILWIDSARDMTEVEYVAFQYQLRGREIPNEIVDRLRSCPALSRIAEQRERAS